MFATPKRHILALNHEFWRILCQSPSRGLGYSELQDPPKKLTPFGVQFDAQSHACMERKPMGGSWRTFTRNHLCQFLWFPRTGFERGGGSNFGLLHWIASSPLQYSRTTMRVCDGRRIGNCTQAFEWYRFKWPWVTSNPDFKVMISFDVK